MIAYKVNGDGETRDKYFFDFNVAFSYAEYLGTTVERVSILANDELSPYFKSCLEKSK